MSDRERTKLSLSVLAAGATLLCAAIALVALIAGPNPQGAAPDAVAERAAPSPAADPIATGALQDHAVTPMPAEPSPPDIPPTDIATPALETSPTQTRADQPVYVADIKPEPIAPSPTITRADEPEVVIASAEPVSSPTETRAPPPAPKAALDMSATQTRDGPPPAGPQVEWTEPEQAAQSAPVTVEPAEAQVLAEAAPQLEAAPVKTETEVQPPEPRRVERPKEMAKAEAVPGRSKMKPMTVGTGGVLPKPEAPKKSAGAGSYSSTVRAAIGRNKAASSGSGSATVTFAIGPGGSLRGAKISKSSGDHALDQAALASVRRAGPFPKPPAGAKSTYSIQIYFH